MTDANYLRDRLKAASTEDIHTCTLCGALISRSWEESHNRFHQADYEPFAADSPGAGVETCKLCGILVNRMYQEMHNLIHHADYEPFGPGAEAESCKLCGILINPAYKDLHLQDHA
jgi:DNA-directed RNA polymerase subunit N (RpoN/RPB10)